MTAKRRRASFGSEESNIVNKSLQKQKIYRLCSNEYLEKSYFPLAIDE